MPFGGTSPANMRIAFASLNQNLNTQQITMFSYLRVGPFAVADPATTRTVSGAATSAVLTGLTQGASYTFQVAAQTAAGWGAPSAPFPTGGVSIPLLTVLGAEQTAGQLALVSQGKPSALSSLYSTTAYLASACNNGVLTDFCSSNSGGSVDPQGGWCVFCPRLARLSALSHALTYSRPFLRTPAPRRYQIDLQGPVAISYINVFARSSCCAARADGSIVYVGNTPATTTQPPAVGANSYFGASGTMTACPGWPYLNFEGITYAMAASQGTGLTQAFAMTVNCALTGRYVVYWQPPGPAGGPANVNLAEVQVYAVSKPPVLISATATCSMSSYYGGYPCTSEAEAALVYFAHTRVHTLVAALSQPKF